MARVLWHTYQSTSWRSQHWTLGLVLIMAGLVTWSVHGSTYWILPASLSWSYRHNRRSEASWKDLGPRGLHDLGLYLGFINPLPGLLAIWLGIRSAPTLWFSCHLFGMYATPPAPFFCCRLFSGAAPLLSITGCLRFLDERHRFGKVSPRISARS